jgi:hypothetical protein
MKFVCLSVMRVGFIITSYRDYFSTRSSTLWIHVTQRCVPDCGSLVKWHWPGTVHACMLYNNAPVMCKISRITQNCTFSIAPSMSDYTVHIPLTKSIGILVHWRIHRVYHVYARSGNGAAKSENLLSDILFPKISCKINFFHRLTCKRSQFQKWKQEFKGSHRPISAHKYNPIETIEHVDS